MSVEEEEEDVVEVAGYRHDDERPRLRLGLPGQSGTLPFAVDGPLPPRDGPSLVPTAS